MAKECTSESEPHFMDQPEVRDYLLQILPAITAESDRGAVLLGASQLDEQLRDFFEALMPASTSATRKRAILGGPFGNFAAKIDIAYSCRLLPESLVQAMHLFRKLRNQVAHKPVPFKLEKHSAQVREIFALLGPGAEVGVSSMTVELMVRNTMARLLELEDPTSPGNPMFPSERAVAEYLTKNRHHLERLEIDQPRWELGVGLGVMCGLILYHRKKLNTALGASKTIVGLLIERRASKTSVSLSGGARRAR